MTEKQKKNEALQSRRQFFKKAAKGVLPILGALAIAQVPLLSNAHESNSEMGCASSNCQNQCITSCKKTCSLKCKDTCENTCVGKCIGKCKYSAKW